MEVEGSRIVGSHSLCHPPRAPVELDDRPLIISNAWPYRFYPIMFPCSPRTDRLGQSILLVNCDDFEMLYNVSDLILFVFQWMKNFIL
jgi:hypothetical protein